MKQNLLFVCLYRINKVDDVYAMITYTDLSNLFISFNALQKLQGKGPFLFLPLLPNHRNVETSQWLLATCKTRVGKGGIGWLVWAAGAVIQQQDQRILSASADRTLLPQLVETGCGDSASSSSQFIVGTNGLPPTAADHSLKTSFAKTKHLKIRFKQIKYTK